MIHVTYPEACLTNSYEEWSYQFIAWIQASQWPKKPFPCLGGSFAALLKAFSTISVWWVVEFCVLLDDAWFYDLACVGSLCWLLMYCGSYICNDISCLVGFLFCTSHILVIFICFYSLEDIARRKLKAGKSWKKEDLTLLYLPTLCLLLSHLPHSNEDPNDQKDECRRSYTQTTKEDDRLTISTTIFLFISLLLVSCFFESRDEIPFKG
jgi:hypothetical protein